MDTKILNIKDSKNILNIKDIYNKKSEIFKAYLNSKFNENKDIKILNKKTKLYDSILKMRNGL